MNSPPWLPLAGVVRVQWDSPIDLENACGGIDSVVHAAGMNAQDCATDPVAALEFNAVATARLLRGAIRQGVRRFIYLSTAHVYGAPLAGAITEETCPTSLQPYATSHRAGEDTVRAAHQRGDIEGIVIRLSNAYGAPAHADANCWTLLVNDLCRQAVTNRRMVLRSSGLARRDFITLTEACRVIKHLLELPGASLGDGLFNAGGGAAPTILEMTYRVAARMRAATGYEPEIVRKEAAIGESPGFLHYGIERLLGSGFRPADGDQGADREIDELIQFCLRHMA